MTPPAEEDKGKQWTEPEMMAYIEENTINQLESLFNKYPKPCLDVIGQTGDIKKRFNSYDLNQKIYNIKEDLTEYIEFNECILFKCWNKFDALMFEFLLQTHTQTSGGKYYTRFGYRMNKQSINKPNS